MNAPGRDALAERITARILQIDGVLRVFPADPAPTVLRAVGALAGRTGVVDVHLRASCTEVEARLGIAQMSSAHRIVGEVHDVVRDAVGDHRCRVHVEIAVIE